MNDVWTSPTQRYTNIQPSFVSSPVLHTLEHRELLLPLGKGSVAPFQNAHIQHLLLHSWTTQLKVWKLPQIGVGITKRYQFIARNRGKTVQLTRWQRGSLKAIVLCVNAEIYLSLSIYIFFCLLFVVVPKKHVYIYIYALYICLFSKNRNEMLATKDQNKKWCKITWWLASLLGNYFNSIQRHKITSRSLSLGLNMT